MKKKFNGVKIFKSKIFADNRGFFKEIYKKKFLKNKQLIFHCTSSSKKNVLRGLHRQTKNPQGKFLTVIKGRIFDVLVDLRKNSKTFGKYFSIILSEKSYSSIYVPEGFAHGFCTLEPDCLVTCKVTDFYVPELDAGLAWTDPDLKIKWPIDGQGTTLSEKDNTHPLLRDLNYRLDDIL